MPIFPMVGKPLAKRKQQIMATKAMEAQAAAKNTSCIIFSFLLFIISILIIKATLASHYRL